MKISNNNGSIRLQFWVNGTRYSLSPIRGGKYESASDLAQAKQVASLIEGDIKASLFDPTLERYRVGLAKLADRAKETGDKLEKMAKLTVCIDLKELWSKYIAFKKPMVSPTTYDVDFVRRVGGTLARLPSTNLKDAFVIRDWLIQNKTPNQARKILTQINAAANWGVECGLLEVNPFGGLAKQIRVSKQGDEINPFTASERDRLIESFKPYYYYHLVRFLFFSGCRPSEALALKLSDISSNNRLTFRQSYVEKNLIKRLKTQKSRTIRVNEQLREIIDDAVNALEGKENPIGLLFPSIQGTYVDWHNFTNRQWRMVLSSMRDIEYRNPYQTRHTFITEAIRAGVSVADVAKHCGNSSKVIWENYVGANRDFEMPEL